MSNHLSLEKKTLAVSMLCEGNSIRGIERMTGIHRDSIMRLGVRMGQGAETLMRQKLWGLSIPQVQVDEIWGFIGAKGATVKALRPKAALNAQEGDVWIWVAIDADTKLIPCFATGKRDLYHATNFMADLASRLINRPQISSDALSSYATAIDRAFGSDVDYGMVVKTFTHTNLESAIRYSPPEILRTKKVRLQGNPDMRKCSTSFVEKQNHTMRMHCRRLSRLTNAFSKKRENFDAAIALHFAYYNFCKIHGSLSCTPAMEARIEKSAWTVRELVERIEG